MVLLNRATLNKVIKSEKDFILFDINKSNVMTSYMLTNDLARHKKDYQYFRVIGTIKEQTEFVTI